MAKKYTARCACGAEGMNETELANYISQKMVELGIEIVGEESEPSALSST
jgi:hypothetical protein